MDTYTLFTENDVIEKWSREVSECFHINISELLKKAERYQALRHTGVPENIDKLDCLFLVCFDALMPFIFPVRNRESLFTSLKMNVFSKLLYTAEYQLSTGSFDLSLFCQTPPPWNNRNLKLDAQNTRRFARFLREGAKTNWAHRFLNFRVSPNSSEKRTSYLISDFLPLFDWLLLILSVTPYSFSDEQWIIKGESIKTIFEGKKKVSKIELKYVKEYLSKGISVLDKLLVSYCVIQDTDSSLSAIERFLYFCRFESATGICFLSDIVSLLVNHPNGITFEALTLLEKMPIFFRNNIIEEIRDVLECRGSLPVNYINDLKYLDEFLIPLSEKLFCVLIWELAKEAGVVKIKELFTEYFEYVLNYKPSFFTVPGVDYNIEGIDTIPNAYPFFKQEEMPYWQSCRKFEYLRGYSYSFSESELKKLSIDSIYTLAEFLRYKYSPHASTDDSNTDIVARSTLETASSEEQQIVFFKLFLPYNRITPTFSIQYTDYLEKISITPSPFSFTVSYISKTLYEHDSSDNLRKITLALNYRGSDKLLSETDGPNLLAMQKKPGIIAEDDWINKVISTELWKCLYGYAQEDVFRAQLFTGKIPPKLQEAKKALETIYFAQTKKALGFSIDIRLNQFYIFKGVMSHNNKLTDNDSESKSFKISYAYPGLLICDYCFTLLCTLPNRKDVLRLLEGISFD